MPDDPRQSDASRRRDEFLAVLAHELRNPLAPIRNWVTVMRDGSSDPLRQKEAFEVIDRQLNRLTRLVDDLLDAARISEGKLRIRTERFELGPAIVAAIQVVEHEVANRRHRLRVELPAEPLLVEADPLRFEQILVNLLGNAVRYTESDGEISVIARNEGPDLTLTVRDTGIGIPPGMLSSIFEPYTQIDATWRRQHGGLGIGLAVVRSLVALHGGVVEARSDGPNRGSEFVVRMPIARGELRSETCSAADARRPTTRVSRGRRVLVVDDNEDSAFSLSLLLQARGHEVRTAHEGPSALVIAREFRPDVALLDLGLPGMDGCELAGRLRALPETQLALLVAVTGYAHDEAREKARAAGFDRHLVKPVALPELLTVIAIR
jgi:CheY-like chemotaxis protein